jgi:hypothetical protein
MRHAFPVPASGHADALAFIRAEQVALRVRTLAAMRKLGPATTRELAARLGITDSVGINRLRSLLCGYERQAYVHRRYDAERRAMVWRLVSGGAK